MVWHNTNVRSLLFLKKRQFFAENWQKSQKIVTDQNIDPRRQTYDSELQRQHCKNLQRHS
jgi:hypothetical protein